MVESRKEKIEAEYVWQLAKELRFTAVGFTKAGCLEMEIERYRSAMEAGFFADLEYLKRNPELREDIKLLVPGAESVIVFLAPFGTHNGREEIDILFGEDAENGAKGGTIQRYRVSQYARGADYHKIIKERLYSIAGQLRQKFPQFHARVFVDTAPVLERGWAAKAGTGFIGKNNFLINKRVGIRNFIGVMVANLPFEELDMTPSCAYALSDSVENERVSAKELSLLSKQGCGNCHRCIDACPTGALAPYSLDTSKCVSYLTVERKGANIFENRAKAAEHGGWIFGCDSCLDACPWNSRNREGWSEFMQSEFPLPSSHLKRR